MTIEEIRNIIEEAEYGYIGIRADSRDYQIGDVMDNSHQLSRILSTMMIIQNCYTLIFTKDLMLDSMMPANLTEHVRFRYLRTTSKRCLKL